MFKAIVMTTVYTVSIVRQKFCIPRPFLKIFRTSETFKVIYAYCMLTCTPDYKIKFKLELWGRAQHDAARRPTSDLKYILGVVRCVKI